MDMSKYMGIFKAESEKYIKEMSDSLLALEKDPKNTEQMNTIFRAAHTFKGMAATMGFKEIVELTHEMESLIDRLRTRQLLLTSSLIDILFICVDSLEELVENACEDKGNGLEKRKKDTGNKYESYPDTREVLRTLKAVDELPEKSCIQKDEDVLLFVEIENNQKQKIPNTEEARLTERISNIVYQIEEEIHKTEKEVYEAEREIHETGKGMFEAKREGKTCVSPKFNPKIKNIQSSRISTEQLDKLMNLVGELVINRSRIKELTGNLKSKELELALSEFYKLTRELQEEVIEVRMVPLDHITHIYPRMVRDLARAQNKEIDFIIKGKEIKLDRAILEEIGDSLVHLLRNAVDHGIEVPERRAELGKKETGTILITALRQENVALIKIEDDGRGIDTEEILKVALKKGILSREKAEQLQEREAMQLIFTPGFSTSSIVTDISGRGIGMDVVKNKIERLGGSVKVESKPGFGSMFELKLPLTIAVYQAMLIRVGKERYAIPFTSIIKNIKISTREVRHIKGEEAIIINNKIVPLLRLQRVFQLPIQEEKNIFIVIVEKFGQLIGIVVDQLLGKQEVIVKNFKSRLLENTRGFAGATILGDGNVVLIIDVNSLI
ncbi:chemotaxis protein CheA [Methanosarcina sp. Z-7115]|uniref:Chemotaxis protein CheA n=1 Tax=Methanosarcina baikalica TaxID=3073890 RepID=A0ABU2D575_9EURY|nr:chemotaxis protein CheA [Methanosarcina sp. Z-7115]MDR7667141.1 chemotaxis protein CheA [Methanosarcina sp. Z-7115]